jgi:hypothetical protein
MAAAMCLAEDGEEEVGRKIERMKEGMMERVGEIAVRMRQNPVVREAAARFAEAMGGEVRDLSAL